MTDLPPIPSDDELSAHLDGEAGAGIGSRRRSQMWPSSSSTNQYGRAPRSKTQSGVSMAASKLSDTFLPKRRAEASC